MLSRKTAGIAAALAPLVALVATGAVLAGTNAGPAKVDVVLKEWKLVVSKGVVPAGKVTFRVHNMGTLEHEMVVLRSDAHHHTLPVSGGTAVEKGRRGEVKAFGPGLSRTLTLNLAPGKYVLICNLLGHYKAGQYAALRVR